MTDSTDDPGPTRRETPISVIHGRAAKALVQPVHEKLGAWQAETIKLETRAQRLKAAGRTDAAVAEATRTLLGFTIAQSAALNLSASEAPEEIATHTRVVDTLKVLAMLTERLERTLSDLGEAPDKRR
jgi:hypothetical protein